MKKILKNIVGVIKKTILLHVDSFGILLPFSDR